MKNFKSGCIYVTWKVENHTRDWKTKYNYTYLLKLPECLKIGRYLNLYDVRYQPTWRVRWFLALDVRFLWTLIVDTVHVKVEIGCTEKIISSIVFRWLSKWKKGLRSWSSVSRIPRKFIFLGFFFLDFYSTKCTRLNLLRLLLNL